MSEALEQREFRERTQQIERLVQRVQAFEDENARSTALDLMRSLMDLHSAVIERMLELVVESGEAGAAALDALASDPMVTGLLVLYGLHPLDLETRVARAVEKVRPSIESQGGTVELLGVSDTEVRVSVQGNGHGCGSSGDVLRSLVEQAIGEAAPEVPAIAVEAAAAASGGGFVPLTALQPKAKENSYEESAH